MNCWCVIRRAFAFFLAFFFIPFGLCASTNGCIGKFFPLSDFTDDCRSEIVRCYKIGMDINSEVTKKPFCENLNVLYTRESTYGDVAVVSGLSPISIDEFSARDSTGESVRVRVICLARVLLGSAHFHDLLKYFQIIANYETFNSKIKENNVTINRNKKKTNKKEENNELQIKDKELQTKLEELKKELAQNSEKYIEAFKEYLRELEGYVEFIHSIRKNNKEKEECITAIKLCEKHFNSKKDNDNNIANKIGVLMDAKGKFDGLVGVIKKYVHSETVFLFVMDMLNEYCSNSFTTMKSKALDLLKFVCGESLIKKEKSLPPIIFTTRDMCSICEDAIVKKNHNSKVVIVSSIEYDADQSYDRHCDESSVLKVAIDTNMKLDASSCSKTDYLKFYSPRNIRLLFQSQQIPKFFRSQQIFESFQQQQVHVSLEPHTILDDDDDDDLEPVSSHSSTKQVPVSLEPLMTLDDDDLKPVSSHSSTKIELDQITACAVKSKLTFLSILIEVYRRIFSGAFINKATNIVKGIKDTLLSDVFSHINQELLLGYVDYIANKLQLKK